MKFTPLGPRVLVLPIRQEEVRGGIIVPALAEKPQLGRVKGLGTRPEGFEVKVGDVVLLPEYGGQKYRLDGKEYLVFEEKELLGIVHPEVKK